MAPLLLALLLAPEPTFDLKLRFEKGMAWEETSSRRVTLKLISDNHVLRFDQEDECVMRRTVVEVGEDGAPARVTVEVVKSVKKVNESPDDKTGATERPSQGKTFSWRRGKDGTFRLYEGEKDVTDAHPDVAQRLTSRSALRLPPGPVAVGGTWEVPARAFEESEGRAAPEGLDGKAVFRLEEVKDGVARVTFELKLSYPERGRIVTNAAKGVWLIDVENGRELKLEGEGKLEIDDARGGFGTQRTSRALTYR
jgi:hypothetical protein